jgi:hypothetical protein
MNNSIESLVSELNDLDKELVSVDGNFLKPSQCYHFETNPVHMLYNTNCPEALKQKIEAILSKHLTWNAGSSQK